MAALSQSGLVIHAATANNATPNTRFTQTIHMPDFGRRVSNPENVPSTTYGRPNPNASAKNSPQPSHGLPLWPTNASRATTNGARHGAAITPITAPKKNTPMYPAFDDKPVAFCMRNCGGCNSYRPNMLNARATSSNAMPTSSTGLCRAEPKSDPVSAAISPSVEYARTIPKK